MPLYSIDIQRDERRVTKRDHTRIMGRVSRTGGRHHRRINVPKHFRGAPETVPGPGGYGFKRRDPEYLRRKKREVGNKPLLVRTGSLSAAARHGRITSTSRKWTFKVRSPFPLNADRRHEVQVMSRREIQEHAEKVEGWYQRLARKRTNQTRRRRRM